MRVTVTAVLLSVAVVAASASLVPLMDINCGHCATLSSDANAVVRENCRQGNASNEWDVNGAGDPTIQGFSTDISFDRGTTAKFKIDTISTKYRIDIFRSGFYCGLGARHVATVRPSAQLPQKQPECRRDKSTMLYECSNWAVSAEWKIPSDAVSGVYLARLVREDVQDGETITWRADNSPAKEDPRFAMPGAESMKKPEKRAHAYGANGQGPLRNALKEPRASLIYFVVRCDSCKADITFQTADTVWQAYNNEGGTSTYGSIDPANPQPRCFKSSYDRPLKTRGLRSVNSWFGSEYPIARYLESNGYDVTYISGVDTDRYGEKLLPMRKVFLSPGHDEYWSGKQRANVERARDKAGVHLAFLSGNEMYWRIRWEDNYRTMVCYKESQSLTKIDPKQNEWTGTFRDSRGINPLGPQPENSVTGTLFTLNAWRNDPLVVPFEFSRARQWANTPVAELAPGDSHICMRGVLGHEMDEDLDNGFRPAGQIRLSETPIDNVMYIQDFGSTFDSGSGTHHFVMYRQQESRALVFGAGTVQLGWALDGFHDSESGIPAHLANHLNTRVGNDILAPDNTLRQFVANVLADMDALPTTLDSKLKEPVPSADRTPPACEILGLAIRPTEAAAREGKNESTFRVWIWGVDNDGHGVVSGAEVQLAPEGYADGEWHPATPTRDADASAEFVTASQARSTASSEEVRAMIETSSFEARVFVYDLVVPVTPSALFFDKIQARCRAVDDSLNLGQPSSWLGKEFDPVHAETNGEDMTMMDYDMPLGGEEDDEEDIAPFVNEEEVIAAALAAEAKAKAGAAATDEDDDGEF